MGFNLKSGNSSALPFKEMGASPAKGIFSKKEKAEPAAALTRPSSTKYVSPSKFGMDMGSMMGGAGGDAAAEGGAAAGGGGGEGGLDLSKATTTDAKGMTENVDKSKQSPAGDDKPKEKKKPSDKKSSGGGSKGPNVGPPPTIAGAQI